MSRGRGGDAVLFYQKTSILEKGTCAMDGSIQAYADHTTNGHCHTASELPVELITVLRCNNSKRATKHWYQPPGAEKPIKEDFDAGTWFGAERYPVSDIHDLSRLLVWLERDPTAFIVRGEPLPDLDLSRPIRRLKHDREDAAATFRDKDGGLHWVPDEFQEVSFHWQFSSSAGIGDSNKVSAHLWFWLNRPVTNAELKAWAKQSNLPVDTALFSAVQPHYTAAPIFDDGLVDPLPCRSGLWQGGSDEVKFPHVELEHPRSNGSAPPARTGEVVADAEKIRGALKVIPSDDYETWFRAGGALWSCVREGAFSEDMGRQLFHEWSATSAKYDPGECDRQWDQCETLTEVSAGTIFHLAKEGSAFANSSPGHKDGPGGKSNPEWLNACQRNKAGPLSNLANVVLALRTDPELRGKVARDDMWSGTKLLAALPSQALTGHSASPAR